MSPEFRTMFTITKTTRRRPTSPDVSARAKILGHHQDFSHKTNALSLRTRLPVNLWAPTTWCSCSRHTFYCAPGAPNLAQCLFSSPANAILTKSQLYKGCTPPAAPLLHY
ncbi:uncharacterized protein CANTADRAFT_232877 [Suhomyces tanzawaensis NRRL Y-17324]|uniref:Uncharacterized protein n=1 Tax=Suhomyces tanzawaensis NRRL Y-17324 TaxID=984487 RepID=A0A1E4SLD0_9ASCO|nr:uncharacterized protein CANTADRAFT_232877 [Suhomyces tanzawaensis NRRL Y-17324]ODV80321.1 hypothetical protein CANTADRAFT_232877 [Suhomyces tanzawaensis NRRL Y-17324]